MASSPQQELMETLHTGQLHKTKVSSLPETLTLRGPRVVLKTPTSEDDIPLGKFFSDSVTVKWLPHFHRSNGWSQDEIALRREKQIAAQSEGKALVLLIHVRGKMTENLLPQPDDDQEVLTLAGSTGFTSVDLKAGTCEIGIILHHPYWRRGIATEALYLCFQYAFGTLGVQTVECITSKDNKGMRSWCENVHLKCRTMMTEEFGESLKFELSLAEWGDRVSYLLEGKAFPRKD